MKNILEKINRIEFEARIFVSFSIVVFVCAISLNSNSSSIMEKIGNLLGVSNNVSLMAGYISLSFYFLLISLFRMWSGGILTPERVMKFKVQTDALIKEGPYNLVRNPIYLSDWLAMWGFALCMPWQGILLPVLFYLHYIRLIKYEEKSLYKIYAQEFIEYTQTTPRLIPTFSSLINFIKSEKHFSINKDGFRHNALYVLFIPGFLIAAFNQNFLYAIIIGIPAVIDWAIIHTKIGINKSSGKEKQIPQKAGKVFNNILYANCWEDPQIDREAFNINEEDIIFSITSGGCNVLTFLLDNPEKIISLDLNPHQNYLLELKINAFRNLNYIETLELFGIKESKRRIELYLKIKDSLSRDCKIFWDKNSGKIKKGIIYSGRYENYMKLLRRFLILCVGSKTIRKFYNYDNPVIRKEIFDNEWNNKRWKIFTRIFLSRAFMSLLFDKAFFKYLEEDFSFGKHFADKTEHALTGLAVKENYFLAFILLGNYFGEDFLPYYLKRKNYEIIKQRLDRIEIVTGKCYDYFTSLPNGSISKFNFTNIFEWISENEFEKLLLETIRVAKKDAIITYRNLLVNREHPEKLNKKIKSQKEFAQKLLGKDFSFIYNNYVVEQVIKGNEKWDTMLKEYKTAEN